MIKVRVLRQWAYPDLRRQSPELDGIWDGVAFSDADVGECDYLLMLGLPHETVSVKCPPENVWMVCQEPPTAQFKRLHAGHAACSRIYTQHLTWSRTFDNRYILSHPGLPWHVDKTYSFLKKTTAPAKTKTLSWITSDKKNLSGHRARMKFLQDIYGSVDFDLYGRGFTPLEDKWDGLADYRYTIAIENHSGPNYFSEKIIDALLAWCMPIYFGCTNLEKFLPPNSFLRLDIKNKFAVQKLKELLNSNAYENAVEPIARARSVILDQLQIYPFISAEIKCDLNRSGAERPRQLLQIKKIKPAGLLERTYYRVR